MWEAAQWALGVLLGWSVRSLPLRRRPPGKRRRAGRSWGLRVDAALWLGRRPGCRCEEVKPLGRPDGRSDDEE